MFSKEVTLRVNHSFSFRKEAVLAVGDTWNRWRTSLMLLKGQVDVLW